MLLPNDKWINDHLDFLRNSQLGSVIAISILAPTDNDATNLTEKAYILQNNFSKLSEIKDIIGVIDIHQSIDAATNLFKMQSQLLSDDDLLVIADQLNPKKITQSLSLHYKTLLQPGGLFRQKMISRDPLNLYQLTINKLKNLSSNSGFLFQLKDSTLWSKDGHNMLILLNTNLKVTDPDKAEHFFSKITKILNETINLKRYKTTIISAHKHAIANKRILKHDISTTMIMASIGFFLLFIVFFKDWRSIYIFLIPIIAMLCSVALTILIFKSPSAIILGLGSTVIGIALDYGIHVYIASRHTIDKREKALHTIKRPLFFSALTTLGVYWAFFFSNTPGYKQLAFASTCGITFSLIFAIFILPQLIPETKNKQILRLNGQISLPSIISLRKAILLLSTWIILIVLSILAAKYVKYEQDLKKMDGINSQLKQNEKEFQKTWGKNTLAAVSIVKDNLSNALYIGDKIYSKAKFANIESLQSISQIWPSLQTRKANALKWDNFWHSNEEKFVKLLKSNGKQFGFSDKAFAPFFETLYIHKFPNDQILLNDSFKTISTRFLNFKNNKYRVTMYFADTPQNLQKIKSITSSFKDVEIISPSSFGQYISSKIINDAIGTAIISFLLICLLATICLKNFFKVLIAFIPVISGIAAIFPVFLLSHTPINAVACVAVIIITGLAIDYGIFSVSTCDNNNKHFSKDAFSALTLSVISTFIGSAALLFTKHPALFSIGLVVSSGDVFAYLSAVYVSPAVYRLLLIKQNN
jgi:predicted exporter